MTLDIERVKAAAEFAFRRSANSLWAELEHLVQIDPTLPADDDFTATVDIDLEAGVTANSVLGLDLAVAAMEVAVAPEEEFTEALQDYLHDEVTVTLHPGQALHDRDAIREAFRSAIGRLAFDGGTAALGITGYTLMLNPSDAGAFANACDKDRDPAHILGSRVRGWANPRVPEGEVYVLAHVPPESRGVRWFAKPLEVESISGKVVLRRRYSFETRSPWLAAKITNSGLLVPAQR